MNFVNMNRWHVYSFNPKSNLTSSKCILLGKIIELDNHNDTKWKLANINLARLARQLVYL